MLKFKFSSKYIKIIQFDKLLLTIDYCIGQFNVFLRPIVAIFNRQ